uniref:Uncharacterized protein n=1 Tax=Heterorhabditis bacteriophora TaxID=37862 RepID=A0A1I7X1Y2_HETBA
MPTVNNNQKGLTSDICIDEKEKNVTNKELTEPTTERPPDVDRLRKCIIEFVHANFLEVLFFPMQSPNQDFDEMLGVQTVILLNKMDDVRLSQFRYYFFPFFNKLYFVITFRRKKHNYMFNISTVEQYSCKTFFRTAATIVTHRAGELIFRMFLFTCTFTIFCIRTFNYCHCIKKIFQILLNVLDTDRNVIPPIFTMTEVSRGIGKRAYMFPVKF